MSNCWAIIIGINQYQGFQPLMQAQNDAVGIRRYLIEDGGFAPENCVLLSDLSTSTDQEAVYPDRVAINDWLETICQGRVQRDDTLWFYFSGYGAQADNKDYLMPVDGDPAQVKQTGIALQDVVKYLKQAPTKNTMMVLDMNRSQSALAGQAIGEQVIKLAQKARIPLIMSCQPNEFSHETLAVRHGLFTAALLEGLRYDGCATLSHLERYLVERIPELCEHHWRPIQNPVVQLPEEQKFQLLWHQQETPSEPAAAAAAAATAATAQDDVDVPLEIEESLPEAESLIPHNPTTDITPDNPDTDLIPEEAELISEGAELIPEPVSELVIEDELPEEPPREPFALDTATNDGGDGDAYGTTTIDNLPDDESKPKGRSNGCLTALGALGALLLIAAVLFRNQPLVQSTLQDRVPPEWLARIGLDPEGGAEGETDGTVEPEEVPDPAEEVPVAETPDNPDAETADDDASVSDASDAELDVDVDDAETGEETDDTGAGDVAATPNNVPAAGNTTPDAATDDTGTAALLEEARRSLRPSQASRFASAIATARQIPPDDPNYSQAQADIQRWSQVILDLAEGRAAEAELEAAISAARLIPSEPADIYQTAQERIGLWQRRADARAIIREAQALPRIGQASTYQEGILRLQEVPEELPIEYADAQRLITDWTGTMLSIARDRADRGLFFGAIEAAELIPEGTANYDQAQAEIRRWTGE
ncbi:MAG: caspase family protein [Cyanobacteria bacterium P01_H01_bin.21]